MGYTIEDAMQDLAYEEYLALQEEELTQEEIVETASKAASLMKKVAKIAPQYSEPRLGIVLALFNEPYGRFKLRSTTEVDERLLAMSPSEDNNFWQAKSVKPTSFIQVLRRMGSEGFVSLDRSETGKEAIIGAELTDLGCAYAVYCGMLEMNELILFMNDGWTLSNRKSISDEAYSDDGANDIIIAAIADPQYHNDYIIEKTKSQIAEGMEAVVRHVPVDAYRFLNINDRNTIAYGLLMRVNFSEKSRERIVDGINSLRSYSDKFNRLCEETKPDESTEDEHRVFVEELVLRCAWVVCRGITDRQLKVESKKDAHVKDPNVGASVVMSSTQGADVYVGGVPIEIKSTVKKADRSEMVKVLQAVADKSAEFEAQKLEAENLRQQLAVAEQAADGFRRLQQQVANINNQLSTLKQNSRLPKDMIPPHFKPLITKKEEQEEEQELPF